MMCNKYYLFKARLGTLFSATLKDGQVLRGQVNCFPVFIFHWKNAFILLRCSKCLLIADRHKLTTIFILYNRIPAERCETFFCW